MVEKQCLDLPSVSTATATETTQQSKATLRNNVNSKFSKTEEPSPSVHSTHMDASLARNETNHKWDKIA